MRDRIIDFIKRNRVTTTEVADCLGKTGAVDGVVPINRGHFCVGVIRWTYASDESNWQVHKDIMDTQEAEIIFIDSFNCNGRAVIGELVSKYLLLYCQAAAIISNAPMRDAGAIIRENYPIWAKGVSPVGCFNTKPVIDIGQGIKEKAKEFYDGAIAVCDDCGVVVIPKELHTEEFLNKLNFIENQEDIWFDRLDHLHENTFEIVCEKKYLKEIESR